MRWQLILVTVAVVGLGLGIFAALTGKSIPTIVIAPTASSPQPIQAQQGDGSDPCQERENQGKYADLSLALKEPDNVCYLIVRGEYTSLPSEIATLKALEVLDAQGVGLRSLPPEIGKLPRLKLLQLDNNNLTSLPDEIQQLQQLQLLSLRHNPLSGDEQDRLVELLPTVAIYFADPTPTPAASQ